MDEKLFDGLFDAPKIKTPKSILEDIREKIKSESNNALSAEVKLISDNTENSVILINFYIKSLKTNYSYKLFYVAQNILLYPCAIVIEKDLVKNTGLSALFKNNLINNKLFFGLSINNEKEFIDTVYKILKSEETRHIIRVIYSQTE